jgi:hypothetical protein
MCKYFGLCGSVENCVACQEREGEFVSEFLENIKTVAQKRKDFPRARYLLDELKEAGECGYYDLTDDAMDLIIDFERDLETWREMWEEEISVYDFA